MDTNTVQKIAKAAKIKLTDAELAKYTEQLAGVITMLDELMKVDTEGVGYLTFPDANRMREDIVIAGLTQTEALANSKFQKSGGFGVPSVLGKAT